MTISFLNAIKDNDIHSIEQLLEAGYSPNTPFAENGLFPLHLAAWYDRPLIIKLLREHGAEVDKPEQSTKKTALHIAAYYGHVDSCKALIHENPSIKSEDAALFIPLHYAALRGHLPIAQLLSESVKDLLKSSYCGTPIDVAIRHQNIELIDYFLTKLENYLSFLNGNPGFFSLSTYWEKAALPIMHWDPVYFATLLRSKEIIQLLLTKKYFRYARGNQEFTSLHLAAQEGYSEIVELLLNVPDYGMEEDKYFSSPLELAMLNGHAITVDLFIEKGAKPWLVDKTDLIGDRPTTTIAAAIWDGNYQQLKAILEHEGKEVLFEKDKKYGDPLLHLAILYRQTEIAKLFIQYGGKELILQKDDTQMTAIHRAAFHGALDLYQHMLKIIGYEILKLPCETFGTPLDCALYRHEIKIVEWTLRQSNLDLSFDELFCEKREDWVLMDLNPTMGGYFKAMEKNLKSNLTASH